MMKNNFIKRVLCVLTMTLSLLGMFSFHINAEWRQSNNNWHFSDKSSMTSCAWLYDRDTNKTYFINMFGEMVTGWVIIDNKWYYFNKDGSLAKNTTIDWKYTVGTDGSWINGVANEYGIMSLYKYTISNGVIISNNFPNDKTSIINNINEQTISLKSIKTVSELKTYLDENYSSLKTPIGTLKFTFDIDENDDKMYPYDFQIETDWGDIENSKYNLDVFSPNDLENSIKINDDDKEKTKELLKNYQKDIANISIKCFPKKKIKGGFYDGWFKYKYIHEGYESIKFYSWKNYEVNKNKDDYSFDDYKYSEVSGFNWDMEDDDYFNN